jgi:hypothetical protein
MGHTPDAPRTWCLTLIFVINFRKYSSPKENCLGDNELFQHDIHLGILSLIDKKILSFSLLFDKLN